jgi:hypothetical protein
VTAAVRGNGFLEAEPGQQAAERTPNEKPNGVPA